MLIFGWKAFSSTSPSSHLWAHGLIFDANFYCHRKIFLVSPGLNFENLRYLCERPLLCTVIFVCFLFWTFLGFHVFNPSSGWPFFLCNDLDICRHRLFVFRIERPILGDNPKAHKSCKFWQDAIFCNKNLEMEMITKQCQVWSYINVQNSTSFNKANCNTCMGQD